MSLIKLSKAPASNSHCAVDDHRRLSAVCTDMADSSGRWRQGTQHLPLASNEAVQTMATLSSYFETSVKPTFSRVDLSGSQNVSVNAPQ